MYDNYKKDVLLNKIMSLDFFIHDLSLYLDTNPSDRIALDKRNKCVSEYTELKRIYEEKFGPLTIYTNINNWDSWVNEPWPWERGNM